MLLCVKYHTFLDLNLPDFWDKAWLWNYRRIHYLKASQASNEHRYSSEDSSKDKPAHNGSLYNLKSHVYYGNSYRLETRYTYSSIVELLHSLKISYPADFRFGRSNCECPTQLAVLWLSLESHHLYSLVRVFWTIHVYMCSNTLCTAPRHQHHWCFHIWLMNR